MKVLRLWRSELGNKSVKFWEFPDEERERGWMMEKIEQGRIFFWARREIFVSTFFQSEISENFLSPFENLNFGSANQYKRWILQNFLQKKWSFFLEFFSKGFSGFHGFQSSLEKTGPKKFP